MILKNKVSVNQRADPVPVSPKKPGHDRVQQKQARLLKRVGVYEHLFWLKLNEHKNWEYFNINSEHSNCNGDWNGDKSKLIVLYKDSLLGQPFLFWWPSEIPYWNRNRHILFTIFVLPFTVYSKWTGSYKRRVVALISSLFPCHKNNVFTKNNDNK